MKKLIPFILFIASLLGASRGQAQPTTLVKPRQYVLFSGLLTNKQAITTNVSLPGQNIGLWTNTLTPYAGSHPIGLSLNIQTTNNLLAPSGASNVVVSVYPAYDTFGGSANGIGESFGTNFATVPILTWTVSYTTNALVLTNLSAAQWEPATSLGFTVSNGISSNTVVTFTMSQAP
jgi:hypothetical protein